MARLKALQEFIIREIFKDAPTGVMRTLPNKELVDMNVQVLAQRLMQGGFDPTTLKNANQVENAINMIESRPSVQQGIKSIKSGKVFDMEGKEIPQGSKIMGGKAVKETEAEILARMNRENKEAAQRIKNRKMIEEAIDNISMGFVKGDKKYNAEILAEEIANKRGLDYFDMDTKQRLDIYDEAFQALTDKDNFATGGRAGYRFGIGPLLRFFSENSPKQAGQKYLKSVKDRAQKGDVKSLAPELGAISATGIFINRRMKDVLENMNEQDKKIDLQNYIKELDADPFFKEYPELKDKMIENYKEVFGETRADGGRAGFANGSAGAPSIKYDFDRKGPGPFGPPFETDDPKEAAREIIRRLIRIEGAQIPISEKGQLGIAIPKLDTIGAGGLIDLLGGEVEFGGMKDFDTGDEKLGVKFRKKFDKGGMSRRKFMKIMGGLASLPILGKFFKGAKPVAKVAEVATKTPVSKPPEYFFDLAAKIKILGKESSTARRERMIEVDYKNYTLEEDLVTGDMTIIKRKGDPDFEYQEEVMTLKKGQADETTKGKTPPDEYEEVTVKPEPDTGRLKEVEDGIEPESIQEIVEEVGQGGGNLDQRTLEEIARGKLASGGVAMMLGE